MSELAVFIPVLVLLLVDLDAVEFEVFPAVSGVSWAARKSEKVRTLTEGRRPPG